ncbi:T9SS type A sorting domain-containing protein [Flavisolibacter sp. BT320]|nr:T9SS type A sorting domain-containing protein [Flavisolibacter longurius]
MRLLLPLHTKKQNLLILLHFLYVGYGSAVFAQVPSIQWQKTLGGTLEDVPQCIYQTTDGGYIVGGASGSKDGDVIGQHGNGDMWVVKLSADGKTIVWRRALGGGGEDKGTLVQQTVDGGYIVGGITSSSNGDVKGNHGGGDAWILKLSGNGNILWQRCLGGSSTDELVALQEIILTDPVTQKPSSGGIFVGMNTVSNNGDVTGYHGGKDVWVAKLDQNTGGLLWQRALGSSGEETLNHLETTADGGCIVGSRTSTNGGDVSGVHGSVDLWVVKLEKDGKIEWKRTLGGSGLESFTAVRQTKDGGYIVGTHCNSNDGDVSGTTKTNTLWIVKLNAMGILTWQKKLDAYGYSEYRDMRQTQDDGFIVCGATYPALGNANALLVKLSSTGNVVWAKEYGYSGNDEPYRIQQTTDKGYIVAGTTNSPEVAGFHASRVDQWLLKLDENGGKRWERAFGGSDDDWNWRGCCGGTTLGYGLGMMIPSSLTPYMQLQSSDGAYFFAISTKSNNGDVTGLHYSSRLGVRSDIWVVKLGGDAPLVQSSVSLSQNTVLKPLASFMAFPNPFSHETTIHFTAAVSGNTTVDLHNADGKKVRVLFKGTVTAGELYTIKVQGAMLPKGIYFYNIKNDKSYLSGRLLKY